VTLRVYSHALEERDRAAAQVMGEILSPDRHNGPPLRTPKTLSPAADPRPTNSEPE
jgi:hypothetical protein